MVELESEQQTILAEIYLWQEDAETSYYGWRILSEGETVHGCSGYPNQYDALEALNVAVTDNKTLKDSARLELEESPF